MVRGRQAAAGSTSPLQAAGLREPQEGEGMPRPLYQAKAELFRTLGHPVRIRVLELLQDGPRPVRDLLDEIGIEAPNLSQQLAVLRRAGLVTSTREGSTVLYTLSTSDVA